MKSPNRPGTRITQMSRLVDARRCASLAHSPLPLIFSYKCKKSLCGAVSLRIPAHARQHRRADAQGLAGTAAPPVDGLWLGPMEPGLGRGGRRPRLRHFFPRRLYEPAENVQPERSHGLRETTARRLYERGSKPAIVAGCHEQNDRNLRRRVGPWPPMARADVFCGARDVRGGVLGRCDSGSAREQLAGWSTFKLVCRFDWVQSDILLSSGEKNSLPSRRATSSAR